MNPTLRPFLTSPPHARHSVRLIVALALLSPLTAPLAWDKRNSYEQHNLVSDGFSPADHTDGNLKNAWGVAFNPNAFVWVADNKTGVSTLYDGLGNRQTLVVKIPPMQGNSGHGSPTGIVFNSSNSPTDFVVSNGTTSGPSAFLFATEEGVIAGWAPTVDLNNALRATVQPNAVYKGLTLAANGTGRFLYAANFRSGKIDVFDHMFQPVQTPGGFNDPSLPHGFAPFNIQNIQGDLYVAYAMQDQQKMDEVAGRGLGIVDVFDADGNLIRRIGTGGRLNAPWGLTLAPAEFGKFSNCLLVGNFGDGAILAFDPRNGTFLGRLRKPSGEVLKIDGLWGLAFGNGLLNQPTSTLFFAAGPDDENHGLYGTLKPVVKDHDNDNDRDDHDDDD